MDSVFFGVSPTSYDNGQNPRVAINKSNVVVEVHQGGNFGGLWYWAGTVDGINLNLTGHGEIANADAGNAGFNPAVALIDNYVVETHDSGGGALWFWLGTIQQSSGTYTVNWGSNYKYDNGTTPSIAVTDSGFLIEVHESGWPHHDLWWWTFSLVLGFPSPIAHAKIGVSGRNPSVAVNNNGIVVVVYASDTMAGADSSQLSYSIGRLDNLNITWIGSGTYDEGYHPSVILDDNNNVYEVHQSTAGQLIGGGLHQRVGTVEIAGGTATIAWADQFLQGSQSYYYDYGCIPAVGGNGKTAVQVHQNSDTALASLYGTAALIFDHANWMGDNLAVLGDLSLRDVMMPASHDAGMYTGGSDLAGKTQDLNILGQLCAGARYFDLRPEYLNDEQICVHHGLVTGPLLFEILAEVVLFLTGNPPPAELIILKFSHYKGFGDTINTDNHAFVTMVNLIQQSVGTWLFDNTSGSRLGDLTMQDLIGNGSRVLVVCDECPPQLETGLAGIYSYRDWWSGDPQNGDLTVFDCFSDTTDLNDMMTSVAQNKKEPSASQVPGLPRGQIPKFKGPGATSQYDGFDGWCYNDTNVQCDLFMLSWTLTPWTGVWRVARTANAALASNMPDSLNQYSQSINLINLDYVEYARATDIVFLANSLSQSAAARRGARDAKGSVAMLG